MRIEQLLYIVEISQTGSISLAAERLHVSQPNISQAIVSLEEELGVKLFKRSRFGATPTEDGTLIIQKAEEILNKLEELKETASLNASQLSGPLSIASDPSLCLSVLPSALALFNANCPCVDLELMEMDFPQIRQEVLGGKMDIGLVGVTRHYKELSGQLAMEPLFESRLMACVGRDSEFADRGSITFEELVHHPLLVNSEPIIQTLHKYGSPNILFKLGNSEAAKRVISEGIAIGFYIEIGLKYDPYVMTGSMIPLEITGDDVDIIFCSLRLKTRHLTMPGKEFMKELKSVIDTL